VIDSATDTKAWKRSTTNLWPPGPLGTAHASSGGGVLPETKIAELKPVPGTNKISIPPTPGVDLLPYIKAGAAIKATAMGHLPAQNTTIVGKVVITVHV